MPRIRPFGRRHHQKGRTRGPCLPRCADLSSRIEIVATSIGHAISALDAVPPECALIANESDDVKATQAAAVPVVAYVKTQDDAGHQAQAGAATFVYSMADLALSLRAHPTDMLR